MTLLSIPNRLSDPVADAILQLLTHLEKADPDELSQYQKKSRIVEGKFRMMFNYRVRWYTVALVIGLVHIYLIGGLRSQGLLFDGIGAFSLALSVIRGRDGMIRDTQSKAGDWADDSVNIDEDHLISTAANTIDGIFGGSLLFVGFTIQYLASISEFVKRLSSIEVIVIEIITLFGIIALLGAWKVAHDTYTSDDYIVV